MNDDLPQKLSPLSRLTASIQKCDKDLARLQQKKVKLSLEYDVALKKQAKAAVAGTKRIRTVKDENQH